MSIINSILNNLTNQRNKMKLNHLKIMLASIGILATLSAVQGMDEKPNESTIENSFTAKKSYTHVNIDSSGIIINSYEMPQIFRREDDSYNVPAICILNSCNILLTILLIGVQFL